MQRDGQFHDAEAGAEMSSGDRHGVDRFSTQLVGHLPELPLAHTAQVGGRIDGVEQWGGYGHDRNIIILEQSAAGRIVGSERFRRSAVLEAVAGEPVKAGRCCHYSKGQRFPVETERHCKLTA